jgi:hypothetical protein
MSLLASATISRVSATDTRLRVLAWHAPDSYPRDLQGAEIPGICYRLSPDAWFSPFVRHWRTALPGFRFPWYGVAALDGWFPLSSGPTPSLVNDYQSR